MFPAPPALRWSHFPAIFLSGGCSFSPLSPRRAGGGLESFTLLTVTCTSGSCKTPLRYLYHQSVLLLFLVTIVEKHPGYCSHYPPMILALCSWFSLFRPKYCFHILFPGTWMSHALSGITMLLISHLHLLAVFLICHPYLWPYPELLNDTKLHQVPWVLFGSRPTLHWSSSPF